MIRVISSVLVVMLILFSLVGCSRQTLGGAAVGAAGAGAAYEYQAKRQMDRLEEDYEAGKITQEEYEARKREIERGSIIY
jgi:osmotically-inducible protein OsmY